MEGHLFDILMVVALGSFAGTILGIVIGYAAKKQKTKWSLMSRKEQTTNIALVFLFCAVCSAGLGYYSLF